MAGQYLAGQQRSPAGRSVAIYPEQSRATAVFVLGPLGIFVLPLLAPFAWTMGNPELAAIKGGRRPPDNRQLARVGQILGIVMSSTPVSSSQA